MSKDTLKSRVRFCTTLKPETHEQLKEMSRETLIPISKLVDMAIVDLLEKRTSVSPKM